MKDTWLLLISSSPKSYIELGLFGENYSWNKEYTEIRHLQQERWALSPDKTETHIKVSKVTYLPIDTVSLCA